ncbi:hypothetical protein V6N12_001540 [Hibiscus sabdariffa]|uniref:Uncharacterized protein n=1 Tax=Hibiscus sabdariffa TaxID=183260 RepID=A0ABR1ZQG0_9ROSI
MSDLMALDIEQVARQNNEQVVVTASDFNDGNLKSPQHMVLRADDSSKVTYDRKLISNDIHARDGKATTKFLE